MNLTIGIVYEGFDAYEKRDGAPHDYAVEYEPESTVAALEEAVQLLGHDVVRIGKPHDLLAQIAQGSVATLDAALSIAEGYGSRNREAWAPNLLEMAGVPSLGSDALTLSLSLDKAWTNRMMAAEGIPVPAHCLLESEQAAQICELPAPFPLFVKPRWEGTSKGIGANSLVANRDELAREVARIVRDYNQPALVEAFVEGAEYTVTIVGHAPARALPVLQRALDVETRIGLHAVTGVHPEFQHETEIEPEHCLPGDLDPALESELQRLALESFALLECKDFARVDFRLDGAGRPIFLEINPLPTFAIDGSFGILAELEGRTVAELLADVIATSLERLGLPENDLNKEHS